MKLLIAGISALEMWDRGISSRAQDVAMGSLAGFEADTRGLAKLSPAALGTTAPCHLAIPGKNTHPYNASWRCHFWNGDLPDGAVKQIGDGLYISSPEFCFVQLAPRLGFLDSVKLGMELCGKYSTLVAPGEDLIKRPALTDASRLRRFVQAVYPSGRSNAARACRLIADGAESPMECATRMLLCLPYRFGCPGFRLPEMNHEFSLDAAESRLLGKAKLRCDLYWDHEKVALEYKGGESHGSYDSLQGDTAREGVLAAHKLTVIPASYRSLASEEGFACLTAALADSLGKRLRVPSEGYLERQRQTRAAVLRGGTCSWVSRP